MHDRILAKACRLSFVGKPYQWNRQPTSVVGEPQMIRIEGVTLFYPDSIKPALRQVEINLNKVEFAFVVGPVGAGKTTLIRMLIGELRPRRGRVLVDDKVVGAIDGWDIPELRRRVGVMLQDAHLLPARSVWENTAFVLEMTGVPPATVKRRVDHALSVVGLAHKARAYPRELSGGEQKRACLARAIVRVPPLLLADEPTADLDPDSSWRMIKLLERVNELGTTVLVATHHREIVDQLGHRVLGLEKGELVRNVQFGRYSMDA